MKSLWQIGIALCSLVLLISSNAPAYVLLGPDWTYQANPMGEDWRVCSQMPGDAPQRTRDGAAEWNYLYFNFTLGADACLSGGTYPNPNGVHQVDFGGGLGATDLAETSVYFNAATGDILECDTRFSNAVKWYTGTGTPAANEYDWWSVATHEMGHCLGLNHDNNIPAPWPVMREWFNLGEVRRALTADDIDGRNAIYGGAPAPPSNLTATAASTSQIDLKWKDNSGNETKFLINRKTGAGGTWSQIATVGANTTTYTNAGLAANTVYFYRVQAYNSLGSSAWSNEASAKTPSPPVPSPPAPPSNLTAIAAAPGLSINLNWKDNSGNETKFLIQRKTGAGGTWSQIATVGANTTTYANAGLAANTVYFYRVQACNVVGCSAWSNEASATTGSLPDLVVTKLNLLVATAKPGGRIRVSDKVKNQGTKAVGGSTTRYYLSSNSMKGPEDTLLSPRKGVGSLVPGGQSSEYAIYVNIPQGTTPGQYFLFACADDLNQWQEISENNNCTAAPTKVTVMR